MGHPTAFQIDNNHLKHAKDSRKYGTEGRKIDWEIKRKEQDAIPPLE